MICVAQVYAYLLPLLVLRVPLSLLVAVLWTAITYFSIGLSASAGRYLPCPAALLHPLGLLLEQMALPALPATL